MNEIPLWLLDARTFIEGNMDTGGGAFHSEPAQDDSWERGYWGGYYDACRHALKALPPYVKFPDAEDWQIEGFNPPGDES